MSPYSYSPGGEEKAATVAACAEYDSGILLCKDYSGIVPDDYKSAAVPEFSELFGRLLDAGGWTTRRFADATGTSQSSVIKTRNGTMGPPLAHLPKWAEALGLTGQARAEFIALGRKRKALAKADIRQDIASLYDEVQESHEIVAALAALVREFAGKLPPEFARRASELLAPDDE